MDSVHVHLYNHEPVPPIKNQQDLTHQAPSPVSDNGFPILAIALLGIMAAAFLLIGYYVLVTKCCLNWHWQQLDPLRRFSTIRARRNDDPLMAYSPSLSLQSRGLDEFLIREIPTFQYSREGEGRESSLSKCVVCLNEFQEEDMLRLLPSCNHAFHLDCIDIWLQTNANCPLCRTSISGKNRYPVDQIIAPNSSPQDVRPFAQTRGSFMDEEFVVIELSGEDRTGLATPTPMPMPMPMPTPLPSHRRQGTNDSREHLPAQMQSRCYSPRKVEGKHGDSKSRKFHHVSIMGDECIDIREKYEGFSIRPLRRSFSMDSAADRYVYLSVQEILRQQMQNRLNNEVKNNGESSNRVRRPFFSFGQGRGSRSSVLPVEF